jgi:hypothetical protein
MSPVRIVAHGVDTWLINIKGDLLAAVDEELDRLKEASQEAEEDIPTRWAFDRQTLFIKAHGSGRQWRWILHCPSLHLDVGRGKLNHIIGKARLASVCLWEYGAGMALAKLYAFLVSFYGDASFTLQVSEPHLCADLAGWDITFADAEQFVSRSRVRAARLVHPADDSLDAPLEHGEVAEGYDTPSVIVRSNGRACTGFVFSPTAPHSCTIYDKTRELVHSRKDWMRSIWERNGWDGHSRVIRVEFRYERECLREMGIEDPFDFLDRVAGMWAYSTRDWLRHTLTSSDTNQGRWPVSAIWQVVQQAIYLDDGEPVVRERMTRGELRLVCQMIAGCSTKAAALLVSTLPPRANAADFLTWLYDWMEGYYQEKGVTFEALRDWKRLQLGVVVAGGEPAA